MSDGDTGEIHRVAAAGVDRQLPREDCSGTKLKTFGLEWLNSLEIKFPISAENVSVLLEPEDFFKEIKKLSRLGKKRITIASLYIGTTELEEQLVDSIRGALVDSDIGGQKENDLRVNILLDYNRGSRGQTNSRTLLLPLLKEFSDKVNLSLYYSPSLRGWLGKLLPERWNETVSLCHLKIYVFDDTLIMSGANLSDQYFRDRQDRYIVFRDCPALTNFFHDLVTTVSSFSFQVDHRNKISLHPSWKIHPFLGNEKSFISEAHARLHKFIEANVSSNGGTSSPTVPNATISREDERLRSTQDSAETKGPGPEDTMVYPLIQMKHLGLTWDESVTNEFFERAPERSQINLASGYFNLTDAYMNAILKECRADVDVLAASPKANGFFGANGMARFIPTVYTCLEKQFFQRMSRLKQTHRVKIFEYERNDWTFHSKGIWYHPPTPQNTLTPTLSATAATLPVLTFIGSPNFGYRSVYRDLEAQVILVTCNAELQKKLHAEQQKLFQSSVLVTETTFQRRERRIPILVRFATAFLKTFF